MATTQLPGQDIPIQLPDRQIEPVWYGWFKFVSTSIKSLLDLSASAWSVKGTRNYIINGAMMVSQENGTTAGTASGYYGVDMFTYVPVSSTAVYSIAQVASRTPAGSPNRLRCTVTTADAAVAAGDSVRIQTAIEGLRAADLNGGTTSAKTITVQFGVKAPAGTYCVAIWNGAVNQSYIAEYVIAAGEANTDIVRSITLTLNTTGTWSVDNTAGLYVMWTLMSGTTSQGPAGSWIGPQLLSTANQFNFSGTVGNVFELFDVSLTEGTVAPPFQVPDYASELLLCLRYWEKTYHNIAGSQDNASNNHLTWFFKVTKRAVPTFTAAAGSLTTGVYATEIDGVNVYKSNAPVVLNPGSTASARL